MSQQTIAAYLRLYLKKRRKKNSRNKELKLLSLINLQLSIDDVPINISNNHI